MVIQIEHQFLILLKRFYWEVVMILPCFDQDRASYYKIFQRSCTILPCSWREHRKSMKTPWQELNMTTTWQQHGKNMTRKWKKNIIWTWQEQDKNVTRTWEEHKQNITRKWQEHDMSKTRILPVGGKMQNFLWYNKALTVCLTNLAISSSDVAKIINLSR